VEGAKRGGIEVNDALRRLGASFVECDACAKKFMAGSRESIFVYPWNNEEPDIAYEPFIVCSFECRDEKVTQIEYLGLSASWEIQSHDAHG
jgi:hypothetical protein